jgi:hypothetical protein
MMRRTTVYKLFGNRPYSEVKWIANLGVNVWSHNPVSNYRVSMDTPYIEITIVSDTDNNASENLLKLKYGDDLNLISEEYVHNP